MKNKLTIISLCLLLLAGFSVNAQTKVKFGYIDSQELLKGMPDREKAEKTLQTEAAEMQKTLQEMQKEYVVKMQAYDSLVRTGNINGLMRQDKEAELGSLQTRIQTYQQNGQKTLQEREDQLLQPILASIQTAIKEVSKENAFTAVFDTASGILLYYNEEWVNIMDLVKKKLGLTK